MRAVLLLILAAWLLPLPARAHHAPDHWVFAVGVPVNMPVMVLACDTRERVREVVDLWAAGDFPKAMGLSTEMQLRDSDVHPGEKTCYAMTVVGLTVVRYDGSVTVDHPDEGPGEIHLVDFTFAGEDRVVCAYMAAGAGRLVVLPESRAHELLEAPEEGQRISMAHDEVFDA